MFFSSDDSDECRFLVKQKSADPTLSRFLNEPWTGFSDFDRAGQEWIGVNRSTNYIFPQVETVYKIKYD